MVVRLQLGASRLENLSSDALEIFLSSTWIHFGDSEREPLSLDRYSLNYIFKVLKYHGVKVFVQKSLKKILDFFGYKVEDRKVDYYDKTTFKDFFYRKGDRLPFEDNSIDYIYSEHFFEHLFFDDSLSLMRECYRILKPKGVIRTCVPDADLRTYAPPEPVGYPDPKLAWNHPSKHKTRWSVYSLAEAIKITGFKPIPLYYCDSSGQRVCLEPTSQKDFYNGCPDPEMVFTTKYIMKMSSLIVDGIKLE